MFLALTLRSAVRIVLQTITTVSCSTNLPASQPPNNQRHQPSNQPQTFPLPTKMKATIRIPRESTIVGIAWVLSQAFRNMVFFRPKTKNLIQKYPSLVVNLGMFMRADNSDIDLDFVLNTVQLNQLSSSSSWSSSSSSSSSSP